MKSFQSVKSSLNFSSGTSIMMMTEASFDVLMRFHFESSIGNCRTTGCASRTLWTRQSSENWFNCKNIRSTSSLWSLFVVRFGFLFRVSSVEQTISNRLMIGVFISIAIRCCRTWTHDFIFSTSVANRHFALSSDLYTFRSLSVFFALFECPIYRNRIQTTFIVLCFEHETCRRR